MHCVRRESVSISTAIGGKAITSTRERECVKQARGAMSEQDYDGEVAEPFRFNFEIAWEVANKGEYSI